MKTATPQEIEQALRDMPEWNKQRLGEVLIQIARNHGLLDTGEPQQEPIATAQTAGGAQ
jgi:hypothetical protein